MTYPLDYRQVYSRGILSLAGAEDAAWTTALDSGGYYRTAHEAFNANTAMHKVAAQGWQLQTLDTGTAAGVSSTHEWNSEPSIAFTVPATAGRTVMIETKARFVLPNAPGQGPGGAYTPLGAHPMVMAKNDTASAGATLWMKLRFWGDRPAGVQQTSEIPGGHGVAPTTSWLRYGGIVAVPQEDVLTNTAPLEQYTLQLGATSGGTACVIYIGFVPVVTFTYAPPPHQVPWI